MDIFSILAEERIRQAMKDGEFENFPGKGKPLELEDLSMIPEELRMSYKILMEPMQSSSMYVVK